jgi:hypothetical protein
MHPMDREAAKQRESEETEKLEQEMREIEELLHMIYRPFSGHLSPT